MIRAFCFATSVSTLLFAGCEAASPEDEGPQGLCEIAVLASDYSSSTLSLLTRDGAMCHRDRIDSGSRPLGLFTALSGDVVLPSNPLFPGQVGLLDRYPNGVLTLLDAQLPHEAPTQVALSPGFAGNPQDFWAHRDTLWISRLEMGPSAGSDLLPLHRSAFDTYELGTPVPLHPYAEPGFDPMPTRLVESLGHLWVGLSHLTRDFSATGPGRVLSLALNSEDLGPPVAHSLSPLTNCSSLAASPEKDALFVACQGLFRGTREQQMPQAGLVRFVQPQEAAIHIPADTLGGPLGDGLAPLNANQVVVVVLGDLVTQSPDRLLLVSWRESGVQTQELLQSEGPFELGDLLYLPENQLLLVADASPEKPRLRRLSLENLEAPKELEPLIVSATGLPPRHLSRITPR